MQEQNLFFNILNLTGPSGRLILFPCRGTGKVSEILMN